MFGRTNKEQAEKLSAVEDKLMLELAENPVDSPEYAKAFDHLERLTILQSKEKRRVSPDQMALVLGNLLGIGILVIYEQKHVLTSKAKDYVLKPK